MFQRIFLDRLEFYITNVCNLTCGGCNRYNNYKFSGWESWEEAEPILTKWSKYIEIRHPVILGGEPLLNPDIVKWIGGLRRLWPEHSGVQVQSNGTRINHVKGLFEALDPREGNWIGISIHSADDKEELFNRIREFLKYDVEETQDSNHPVGSDFQFANRTTTTKVHAWLTDKFVQSNLIQRPDGTFTLYNSNPTIAHETCTFRQFKNYHMIRGKIYKCGPAGLMPEFDQQYPLDISEEDRKLLYSYRPLSVDEFDERGVEFFNNIDQEIPQCKFCPEKYEYKPIVFSNLKKDWKQVKFDR